MTEFEEYKQCLSEEIRSMLEVSSNRNQFGILLVLLDEGEKSLNELQSITGLERDTLKEHIGNLEKAALISNIYKNTDEGPNSVYRASRFGEIFMDSIIEMENEMLKGAEE